MDMKKNKLLETRFFMKSDTTKHTGFMQIFT